MAQQLLEALFVAWTRTLMLCLTLMRTFSGKPGRWLLPTGAVDSPCLTDVLRCCKQPYVPPIALCMVIIMVS